MDLQTHTPPYAIQIKGLKKQYRLGQIGGGTLRGDLASWWAKKCGKEDPNSKIGSAARISGETFLALNGIDLTISQGETVGIIGKNGAGKSTLLKILSRVTAPTEGEIDIYGRISSMLEVGTGFHREMTGRENIYMNGAILGMSKAEIDAKMDDIIAFSEVSEFIDTPVKRYSSGMYVKLAFSVAAHLESEIIIMDEVLAVGDIAFQKKCLDKMKDAARIEGRTVLYVSHNMATIRQLCERCIVLDEGKIIFDGDAEQAIECYMGSDNALQAHRTFENKDYRSKKNALFRIISLDLDRIDCQYDAGEPVGITMKIVSAKDMEGLHFRFQCVARDGVCVGTSFTASPFAAKADREMTLHLKLPTDTFSVGQYLMKIIVFHSGTLGAYQYINAIENGFSFEIKPANRNQAFIGWNPYWGYVHLPDTELEVMHDES